MEGAAMLTTIALWAAKLYLAWWIIAAIWVCLVVIAYGRRRDGE
jgi:hypothetical protein